MECNKDEAIRAKDIAETKMINNDFEGGRKFALKAQKLYPDLENISQMLAVCDVHCAAKRLINGAVKDLYGILQVESLADMVTIKKQYRKLALVLHPDKNHFPGAETAFKLICEANMVLSDEGKRILHDYKCKEPATSSCQFNGVQQSQPDLNVQPTFWTICPFCKIESQHHRDAVNRRIKCFKCSLSFIAIDTGRHKSAQTPSEHAGTQNVNPQEGIGKQKKAKVRVETTENGELKTKRGKEGVATGGHQQSQPDLNAQPTFWMICPFCKLESQQHRDVINRRTKCSKCALSFIAIDTGRHKSSQTPSAHAGMQNVNPQEGIGKKEKAKDRVETTENGELKTKAGKEGVATGGHQQSQPDLNVQPAFWMICPFCKLESQQHRDVINSRTKCSKCSLSFIAVDTGRHKSAQTPSEHAGKQNVNPQDGIGKQEKAKAKVRVETTENGELKTKGKEGFATGSDSNGKNVESSIKRSHREEVVKDFSPIKRSRPRKSSGDVKEKQKETSTEAELKGNSDSDSEGDLVTVFVDVPDLEFSNFDKDKEEDCFAVDQIWAVYDTVDSMPRFYAQIKKVYSSEFKLRIMWLEADPDDVSEKYWAQEGLPVACGKFKRGDSEETKDRLMFSHQMAFKKVQRFSFVIYPKMGEIWALFKDWDITKWSSDPENHKKYKFEIVEILSDFDKDIGFLVAYMVRVKGFVCLFQKRQLAKNQIPSSDLFRFSHRIPSLKLTGNERADVPAGSYELDTASLPDDLDQFYFSDDVKAKPGRSTGESGESTGVEHKSNVASASKPCFEDVNISSTQSPSPSDGKKATIHNFRSDKQKWKFEAGQIWAVGKVRDVSYVQIKKIEPNPLRLHVDILELCSDADRPNACGIYKASTGGRRTFNEPDSFLYPVKAEVNGKNRFNIFPREKDIWVLCYKRQDEDSECTFVDLDVCDCDIVEVVENNGDFIKVLCLAHVNGYKSVFKGGDRVEEIPFDESHRFLYQVPAVLLTDEEDGLLRGFWELDLAEFPGLVP